MAELFPTVAWARGSNVYEVNIRQYTPEGTFEAFRQHLPRLQDMGVEILWLMPITPISVLKRKGSLGSYYACASYTQINPEFGDLSSFRALVNDVHSRGMKIIIDWVANHTGADHHWVVEHPEWYRRNAAGEFFDDHEWSDVIDLDYRQPALWTEMIRSMQYWIHEAGIDGFRCDMAHLVPLDFWKQARTACDAIKPLFWLAETDERSYHAVFDSTYAWNWMHVSLQFIRGESDFHQFTDAMEAIRQLPGDCYKLMFTTNHDENSWNGTEYEKYGAAAKALAVLCNTFPSIPLIYSGQELPNQKRLSFFDKDQIDWTPTPALHDFYRQLLQLRHQSAALRYGRTEMINTGLPGMMAFLRRHEERVVLVLMNLSPQPKQRVLLHHASIHGVFTSLFSGLHYQFEPATSFELDAWDYLVYYK